MALVFVPLSAYAEGGSSGPKAAENLGWIAVGCGIAANLSLMVFKMAMRLPVMRMVGGSGSLRNIAPMYKPVLDLHVLLNSVGFVAGLLHGFMLVRGLDYVSLSLAIVMTASVFSGVLLRFAPGRSMKFMSRLIHGQVVMTAMLATLVALHIITRWHHGMLIGLL